MGGSSEDKAARNGDPGRKPLVGLHDVELARLAMAADRAAFAELARRHGSGLRLYLQRLGCDKSAADLLASELFASAFDQIADYRGEGPFALWMRRLAGRAHARRWRRLSARDLVVPDTTGVENAPPLAPWTEADSLDLDAALERLTEQERLAAGLVYGAHLGAAETAELLGMEAQDLRTVLRSALVQLRLTGPEATRLPAFAADPPFEAALVRAFAEAPTAADAKSFASDVAQRLDRGWTLRRWLIGALGVAGGMIAMFEVASSNVISRGVAFSQASVTAASRSVGAAPALANLTARLFGLAGAPLASEVVWAVIGLLVLAGGFLVARVIEEI